VNELVFAQINSDASITALIRRLIRGGIGVVPGSAGSLLLLVIVWLAVLVAVTAFLQTDRTRWLRGLVDIRGHFEQIASGLEILRRNKRPLWVLLVGAVLSWTGWSLQTWQEPANKDELEVILAVVNNSAARFAASHALAIALAPLRCLAAPGDFMPLLIGACILLFARTGLFSQHLRSRTRAVESVQLKRRLGTIWISLMILIAYRAVVFIVAPDSAPMADCMYLNALLFPIMLLAADAVLMSWVLAEFGRSIRDHFDWKADDTVAFVRSIPAAAITCLLLNPGRYVLVTCAIWQAQFATPTWLATRWLPILWGCTISQVLGLTWLALPGILAIDRRPGIANKLKLLVDLARRAGGQLAGLTIVSVVLTFVAVYPFLWIFGTMQRETWSLLGAASYSHYASLLLGIILLSGFTQLAQQELGMQEAEAPKAVLLHSADLPDMSLVGDRG
jgi:hypothetical protein